MSAIFGTYQWQKVVRPTVLQRDGYVCKVRVVGICANLDGKRLPASKLEVDHIKPRRLGGTDEYTNLRASCISCNRYRASGDTKMKSYNSREW